VNARVANATALYEFSPTVLFLGAWPAHLGGALFGYLYLKFIPGRGLGFATSEKVYGLRNAYHRWKRRQATKKFKVYMNRHQDDPKRFVDESELLGLIAFFTVGEEECRAWTITQGTNAQHAAGVIHTDLRDHFIRAEVCHYEDFAKYKGYPALREKGLLRLEGKEYTVLDGDIMEIRHSG